MTEIWKDSSGHWITEPGDSLIPYTLYSFEHVSSIPCPCCGDELVAEFEILVGLN